MSHLGSCSRFALLQPYGNRWTVAFSPLLPPDTACNPYGLEVGAWLAAGSWEAPEARTATTAGRSLTATSTACQWPVRGPHPLAQDGACRL